MIISHKYKFIFLKTTKTAGTSVEISLSRFCGDDDVITPISLKDEAIRKLLGKRPQNYLDFDAQGNEYKKYFNHITAKEIQCVIEPSIWDSYYKFCFERNPFDRAISLYYFLCQNKSIKFDDWLKNKYTNPFLKKNWNIYTINDKVVVDFIGKYENIRSDLTFVCQKLNIPFDGYLPKAKGFFRNDNRPYYEFLNGEQMQIIRECNSNVIDLLGYDHENQNNHKISILEKEKEKEKEQPQNYTQEYYNQIGYQLQKQGKLDEALIAYAQAIGINPQKYWAYYHTLGGIFRENNRYREAVEAYHQAIKIKPDFPWSHYHLGVVLEKQGKLDKAFTSYQNAINLGLTII